MSDWKRDRNLGPWEFTESTADPRYNEGNLISSAQNPVWDTDFTGDPITPEHDPCGYWYKGERVLFNYIHLTSRPYPLVLLDEIQSNQISVVASDFNIVLQRYENWPVEELDSSQATVLSGTLRTLLQIYDDVPEELDSAQVVILSGTLRTLLQRYENWPIESLDSAQLEIMSGTLAQVLIRYEEWPIESLDSAQVIIMSGTLTIP